MIKEKENKKNMKLKKLCLFLFDYFLQYESKVFFVLFFRLKWKIQTNIWLQIKTKDFIAFLLIFFSFISLIN